MRYVNPEPLKGFHTSYHDDIFPWPQEMGNRKFFLGNLYSLAHLKVNLRCYVKILSIPTSYFSTGLTYTTSCVFESRDDQSRVQLFSLC